MLTFQGKVLIKTCLLFILSVSSLNLSLYSQVTTEPISEVLSKIEKTFNVRIYFQPSWLVGARATTPRLEDLDQSLRTALVATDLSYTIVDDKLVVLLKEGQDQMLPSYTLRGQVLLENDDSEVIGATVLVRETGKGVATDINGNFSITIEKGTYHLIIKSLNTIDKLMTIPLNSDTLFQVRVFDKTVELEGVVVTGQSIDDNVTNSNAGRMALDIESVKNLPAFMGEVDVTKIIQTLPGVTSIGEGTSGFNVRGGNIDQNLILFDNIPIYNSSHLLGFFSVFNPDIVGSFTLFKGAIPANYGGRLSSLLNVTQKTPDKNQTVLSGGIGPVNNRFAVELPLIKNRTSLLVSGRYANPAIVLNNFQRQSITESDANYGDLNIKYHDAISETDVISLSSYLSTDSFSFSGDSTYSYNVAGLSAEWNHQYTSRLTSKIVAYYSDYNAQLLNEQRQSSSQIDNGIQNIGLNSTLSYFLSEKLVADIGFNLLHYNISPGELSPINGSGIRNLPLQHELAFETGWFINTEYKINNSLSINGGVRYSTFSNIGSRDEPIFDPSAPKSATSIIGFIEPKKGSIVRTVGGVEPRLSATVLLSEHTSLKAAYSLNRQYIHLFTNATAALPTDIWKVSDSNLKPQIGHQYSLGIFRNFLNSTFETSAEGFYRDITQLAELRTGAPVLLNQYIEKDLFQGVGRAYGLELYVKKQLGRATGWVSYTLSRTERRVKNEFVAETFNQGNFYPANFDSPHNINIASNLKLSRLWSISWNFVFQSGRPVTLPQSSFLYTVNNDRYFTYLDRNNFRIPNTHRLDLSFTLAGSNKRNSPWENSFTFSIYNLYGRDNPFSVYVNNINASNSIPRVFQLAVLGSAFPSFTFNFKYRGTKK